MSGTYAAWRTIQSRQTDSRRNDEWNCAPSILCLSSFAERGIDSRKNDEWNRDDKIDVSDCGAKEEIDSRRNGEWNSDVHRQRARSRDREDRLEKE